MAVVRELILLCPGLHQCRNDRLAEVNAGKLHHAHQFDRLRIEPTKRANKLVRVGALTRAVRCGRCESFLRLAKIVNQICLCSDQCILGTLLVVLVPGLCPVND